MKKQKTIKFFLLLFILSIGFREAYFKYKEINEEKIENENQMTINALSEQGLYFPKLEKDQETNILEVRTIHKYELDNVSDLTECDASHINRYKSDVEKFLDSKACEWSPGNWSKTDADYRVEEYKDGTSIYINELMYYSNINTQTMFFVGTEIDAVSERIHNIYFYLPYKENAQKTFIEILTWLGIETSEAVDICHKMLNALDELEENKRIAYDIHDFHLKMVEQEFKGNGEIGKAYRITIMPYS